MLYSNLSSKLAQNLEIYLYMKNKILITGGSSGIGLGIAEYFYNNNWDVLITGRNQSKLEKVSLDYPGIHTMVYNSSNQEQIGQISMFITESWEGRLDILVNNGGHVNMAGLDSITSESLVEMYEAHLLGPTLLSSECLEFLKKSEGQILNITSSHGIKAYPQLSAYGSAKAGLNMLTKIWALELAPYKVRVNAIAPGPTETGILKAAGFTNEELIHIHEYEKEQVPLKRRGQVSDIVQHAISLLNLESTWVTGVLLPIDGGISIS